MADAPWTPSTRRDAPVDFYADPDPPRDARELAGEMDHAWEGSTARFLRALRVRAPVVFRPEMDSPAITLRNTSCIVFRWSPLGSAPRRRATGGSRI